MDSLPNEIILLILENLDYFDLNCSIPLVSQRFNLLTKLRTKTGRMDQKMFRDIPVAHTVSLPKESVIRTRTLLQRIMTCNADTVILHPIFNMLSWGYCKPMQDIMIVNGERTSNLIGSNILKENAISPAVDCLTLCITEFSPWVFFFTLLGKRTRAEKAPSPNHSATNLEEEEGKGEGANIRRAITVGDVINCICSFLHAPVRNAAVVSILSHQDRNIRSITNGSTEVNMGSAASLAAARREEIVYKWGKLMMDKEFNGFQKAETIDGRVFVMLDQRGIGAKVLNEA